MVGTSSRKVVKMAKTTRRKIAQTKNEQKKNIEIQTEKEKKREILAGNTNNLTNPFQGDATEEDTMKKRRNKILEQKIV